jgi:hypothetical protein
MLRPFPSERFSVDVRQGKENGMLVERSASLTQGLAGAGIPQPRHRSRLKLAAALHVLEESQDARRSVSFQSSVF